MRPYSSPLEGDSAMSPISKVGDRAPQNHLVAGTTLLLILSLQNHHRQVFSLSYELLSLADHLHVPIK